MISTAVFGDVAFTRDSASMPSSSGIRTSMITRSGLDSFTLSTTSIPVVASSTAKPWSARSCLRRDRIDASSSATNRVFCATSLYGSFPRTAGLKDRTAPTAPLRTGLCPEERTRQGVWAANRAIGRAELAGMRSGDFADRRNEAGGEGDRGHGEHAGERDERPGIDDIGQGPADEDDRQPGEIEERDPGPEDPRPEGRRRRLLGNRDVRNDEDHVRRPEEKEQHHRRQETLRKPDQDEQEPVRGETPEQQLALSEVLHVVGKGQPGADSSCGQCRLGDAEERCSEVNVPVGEPAYQVHRCQTVCDRQGELSDEREESVHAEDR